MLKKQLVLLVILVLLVLFVLGGCFGKNTNSSGDKGSGVVLVRDGERVKVIAEDEIAGGSFVINQAIESDNILVEADKMKIVNISEGKTYVSIVDVDSPSVEGDKLFELKNISKKVEIEMTESVNEGNFEKTMKKAYKSAEKKGCRAITAEKLLGDFNLSSLVDITDFLAFKANYASTTALYDIAPAEMGTKDYYSICTPDGSVGLLDFLVFGRNYGKGTGLTVTGVTLSGATTVEAGSTIDITATVLYSNGTTKSEVVEWSTSDETVATQTPNGEWTKVTGVKEGTVTIKASINGKVGECTVKVTPVGNKIDSIEITGGNGVAIGGTLQLTATSTLPNGTTETTGATWTSSNTAVATVDSTGKVTGLTAGKTKIKAVRAGVSHEITVVVAIVPNGVKVHAKGYKTIYAWEGNNVTLAGGWPGTALSTTGESTGWGSYYFEGKDGISIIFIDASGNKTGDLTGIKKGEHWYLDGKWYDYNPDEDFIAPEITATPEAGNQEPSSVEVVLSAKDNIDTAPKIYYTTNGTMPTISSTLFNGKLTLTADSVIKAIAVDAKSNVSKVYVFSYKLNQDATAPTVKATPAPGRYETAQSVKLTVTDNRDTSLNIYYTIDGSEPKAELSYLYNGQTLNIEKTTTIKTFTTDKAGNGKNDEFTYMFGKVATTRFDPRQESIYFLLTARWFDGDSDNSVGDQNCSYTKTRAANAGNGFTGPEDVSWRGDFKGLVEKLDYIKALGFTTIWITPIVQNRSPLSYHGYHGWDFTKEDARLVSPGYGFQRVIDEAHKRDMKICLDIVLNHSGPMGIKDFAELKYNTPETIDGKANTSPLPDEWNGWKYDESRYRSGLSQNFPNGWFYDGLHSPGTKNGVAISPSSGFGTADLRPFTAADKAQFSDLANITKYWYDSTMSYCTTIDGKASYTEPNSLTYDQYKKSKRRMRGHNTGFPTGSGSFDNFPDAHFDSLHNHCPDLNTENPEVQEYLLKAYSRYIDMGVDMFRVDTVMHIHKQTLNEMYWPQLLERAKKSAAARGGSDFFIFGEVANFVCNPTDKATQLREQNYTWDQAHNDVTTNNHLLDGNSYRTPDYSAKAPNAAAPYHVSVINMIAHNAFCNDEKAGYNTAVGNDKLYNDATFMPWYADSHDYGPNKGATRYTGDFAPLWSMLFTFRGIPVVYYGSEIKFQAGLPNDWPTPGSSAGTEMSLEKTGRGYYGPHLEGTVTATDFGEYTASGTVATTLSGDLSKHLMGLNKIRLAVPALQMGQYSIEGHTGGWAGYKRRYTGVNKITGSKIDSYALVGVGVGTHSWTGVLPGTYVDCVTGNEVTASGGNVSFKVANGGSSGLGVYVLKGLATPAPGKITQPSPYLK